MIPLRSEWHAQYVEDFSISCQIIHNAHVASCAEGKVAVHQILKLIFFFFTSVHKTQETADPLKLMIKVSTYFLLQTYNL